MTFTADCSDVGKFVELHVSSVVRVRVLNSASGSTTRDELAVSSPPLAVALLALEPVLSSRIFSIDLSISFFTSCLIRFSSESVYRTGMGIVGLLAVSLW